MSGGLAVRIDGEPLPADEAIAFWKRFSAWMEEHPGDLAGFARAEGLASVHPEMHEGMPMLSASRTLPQRPYGVAPKKGRSSGAAARPSNVTNRGREGPAKKKR